MDQLQWTRLRRQTYLLLPPTFGRLLRCARTRLKVVVVLVAWVAIWILARSPAGGLSPLAASAQPPEPAMTLAAKRAPAPSLAGRDCCLMRCDSIVFSLRMVHTWAASRALTHFVAATSQKVQTRCSVIGRCRRDSAAAAPSCGHDRLAVGQETRLTCCCTVVLAGGGFLIFFAKLPLTRGTDATFADTSRVPAWMRGRSSRTTVRRRATLQERLLDPG